MSIIPRPDPGADFDMAPDGRFLDPPQMPLAARIFRTAVIVAVLAAGLAMAALALWFALILIPVAIGAALLAYGAFRWRLWRSGRL